MDCSLPESFLGALLIITLQSFTVTQKHRQQQHNRDLVHAQYIAFPCTPASNFTHKADKWIATEKNLLAPKHYVFFLALSMRSSFRCLRFAFFRAICSSFNSTDDAQNAAQRRGTIMAQKPRSQGHGSNKTVMTIASSLVAFCVNR